MINFTSTMHVLGQLETDVDASQARTMAAGTLWQPELSARLSRAVCGRLSNFHGPSRARELTSNPGFQRVVEMLEKQAEYLSDKACLLIMPVLNTSQCLTEQGLQTVAKPCSRACQPALSQLWAV